jgi:hypothetical protein
VLTRFDTVVLAGGVLAVAAAAVARYTGVLAVLAFLCPPSRSRCSPQSSAVAWSSSATGSGRA